MGCKKGVETVNIDLEELLEDLLIFVQNKLEELALVPSIVFSRTETIQKQITPSSQDKQGVHL